MSDRELVSFTLLFKALVHGRRFIVSIIIGGSIVSLVLAFTLPKTYTSDASILPSGKTLPLGTLGSALNMMNIDADLEIPPNSSYLFPTILSSRSLRCQLLATTYDDGSGKKRLDVILGTDSEEQALKKLDRIIDVGMEKRTGIISIRVTTRNAQLSAHIAGQLILLLEKFNREKRHLKDWQDYDFLVNKLKDIETELFAAEKTLMEFEMHHRDHITSTDPHVIMEHDRLLRDLRLQHEIYIDLMKQVELADIELKKETPLVKVLDAPAVPQVKSGPGRKAIALLGGTLSLLVGLAWPILREVSLIDILRGKFVE